MLEQLKNIFFPNPMAAWHNLNDKIWEIDSFGNESNDIIFKVKNKLMTKKEARGWLFGKKDWMRRTKLNWYRCYLEKFQKAKIIKQADLKMLIS